ncbi:MAG TPA: hypothetical protein VEN47_02685, partial [Myxococcota bacterium]|nr:hypothetical protein [Myxococcota bacterium]
MPGFAGRDAAEPLEREPERSHVGLRDADLSGDHDRVEPRRDRERRELVALRVAGAVGDEGERNPRAPRGRDEDVHVVEQPLLLAVELEVGRRRTPRDGFVAAPACRE